MATKGKCVVTDDQYRTIDRRMRDILRQLDQKGGSPLDPVYVSQVLQWIGEGVDFIPTGSFTGFSGDLMMPGANLFKLFERQARLTHQDARLISMCDGDQCDAKQEVLLNCFRRRVTPEEVSAFFRAVGFSGNNRVFLSWLLLWEPRGMYATVPDDSRWAICFRQGDGVRELRLVEVSDLDDRCTFVAFRRWTK